MASKGLTSSDAAARLKEHGSNSLPKEPPTPWWKRVLAQFESPIIWLLLVALGVDGAAWLAEGRLGVPIEALTIGAILVLNAGLGAYQEHRADRALQKLEELGAPRALAYRDGELQEISAEELVPGDVVVLESGSRIPADGKLVESSELMVDESSLTGESVPVEKKTGGEVFSGTQAVRGEAEFEVAKTGPESALGRLATSLEKIAAEKTPLEKRVEAFSKQVAQWVLVLAALLVVAGVALEGLDAFGRVLLLAVALAVAAVPEGMPAVLTLTLARGIERMARKKAVVRRMAAVESLGSVTLIAADKTGTMTENKLTVSDIVADDRERMLEAVVLTAAEDSEAGKGDPMDAALLAYAKQEGADLGRIRGQWKRVGGEPFSSEKRYMTSEVEREGKSVVLTKGAPEAVLARTSLEGEERKRWEGAIQESAAKGSRLLAFASDKEFLGLALLLDPARKEVKEAIRKTLEAGIRVVMVTGDHPDTAKAIAEAVGLSSPAGAKTGEELKKADDLPDDLNIYARVLPDQKLHLVEMLKEKGHIVAMTGDGVNDAPALKKSDVGIAMGKRGTDVAREVADLVLLDDNFETIVSAVEEGRSIYANIQKFIRFLFATNLAEIVLVVGGAAGAAIAGLRTPEGGLLMPLTAAQLLWINVVTDGPPALALGFDESRGYMKQPPRDPAEPLLDRDSRTFILVSGSATAAIGLGLLLLLPQIGSNVLQAQTCVFQFMAAAQLVKTYPSRGLLELKRFNGLLLGAVLLGLGLQAATLLVPPLRAALGLTMPSWQALGIVAAAVALAWGAAEAWLRFGMKNSR